MCRTARLGAMEPGDLELRNLTYGMFVELGRAPSAEEVAAAIVTSSPGSPGSSASTASEVRTGWARLHAGRALVLNGSGTEIRMANPFSAVPTAYRVRAAGRWWYANCAWDAFGVCAALHSDGTIETSCADCGDPLSVDVRDRRPDDPSLLFHCLVPAAQWWDDIVFT